MKKLIAAFSASVMFLAIPIILAVLGMNGCWGSNDLDDAPARSGGIFLLYVLPWLLLGMALFFGVTGSLLQFFHRNTLKGYGVSAGIFSVGCSAGITFLLNSSFNGIPDLLVTFGISLILFFILFGLGFVGWGVVLRTPRDTP